MGVKDERAAMASLSDYVMRLAFTKSLPWELRHFPNQSPFLRLTRAESYYGAIVVVRHQKYMLVLGDNQPDSEGREIVLGSPSDPLNAVTSRICHELLIHARRLAQEGDQLGANEFALICWIVARATFDPPSANGSIIEFIVPAFLAAGDQSVARAMLMQTIEMSFVPDSETELLNLVAQIDAGRQ